MFECFFDEIEIDCKSNIYSDFTQETHIVNVKTINQNGIWIWSKDPLSKKGSVLLSISRFSKGMLHSGKIIQQVAGDRGFYIRIELSPSSQFRKIFELAKTKAKQ